MKMILLKQSILILLLASGASLAAAENGREKAMAPIFEQLGDLHHPVTTSSKKAQKYFDQGLMLCYAFNHKEAIRSFEAAAKLDPNCAMAYWGIAYASGPHVNKPMFPEDTKRAWGALQMAISLQDKANAEERAYIDALSKRYQEEHKEDRADLDKAYADAMRELARQYPDDLDAKTLFAEALMDTMPWDYWKKNHQPKPETEEVFQTLRAVIVRQPDHPGANHLYIHAVEAGPTPEIGLPSADRLLNYAPQAGHLVHMPSHIYIRVGQYRDAVASNERAIKADKSYLAACRAQGFYPAVYYPHNLHFLWYALSFEGRSREALSTARKIVDYEIDARCGASQFLEAPRLRHLPWITAARFGRWDDILSVPEPPATNDFVMDRVMWHFTRGLAFVARKDAEAAARENDQMVKLIESDASAKLDNPQLPATGMFAVASHLLAGKLAGVQGNPTLMIAELEKAVQAEDALPYMEPAYWPFPTRPALGAALLEAGKAAQAEQVFREDLERFPRNGWGLLGLKESLARQNKTQAAELVQNEFNEAWKDADIKLTLAIY